MTYFFFVLAVVLVALLFVLIPHQSPTGRWGSGATVALLALLLGIVGGVFLAHEPHIHALVHDGATELWTRVAVAAAPAAGQPAASPQALGVVPVASKFKWDGATSTIALDPDAIPSAQLQAVVRIPGDADKVVLPGTNSVSVLVGATRGSVYFQELPTAQFPSGRTSASVDIHP